MSGRRSEIGDPKIRRVKERSRREESKRRSKIRRRSEGDPKGFVCAGRGDRVRRLPGLRRAGALLQLALHRRARGSHGAALPFCCIPLSIQQGCSIGTQRGCQQLNNGAAGTFWAGLSWSRGSRTRCEEAATNGHSTLCPFDALSRYTSWSLHRLSLRLKDPTHTHTHTRTPTRPPSAPPALTPFHGADRAVRRCPSCADDSAALAMRRNVSRPRTLSQRDVPGLSIAAVPLLAKVIRAILNATRGD